MNINDAVMVKKYGPGVIVYVERVNNGEGKMVSTGRYGVVLENHHLIANPAYFWRDELRLV